jgi:phosphoglycerol transferase MdoB-like AlkP superfamily enzyme
MSLRGPSSSSPASAGGSGDRYALIWVCALAFLATSSVTRLGLWLFTPAVDAPGVADAPQIFAVGLLYDLSFLVLANLPCALVLWLIPQRVWKLKAFRWASELAVFTGLYVLGFIVVAEFVFWEEFGARFNFISVDYLIYRQEVMANLWESYPLVRMLGAILLAALAAFAVLRGRLQRAFDSEQSLRGRSGRFGLISLAAALVVAAVSQGPRESLENAYARELASSGPYQFFAAFRNNELDYRSFYPLVANSAAASELHRLLSSPAARPIDPDPMGIYRGIDNPGPERRYNIMMIMVESLSARYLGRFGNPRGLTPNLDALAENSLFFSDFYATGTRTTRGLEAVTLSIPPTPGRSIVKRIGRETGFWSLGNVLREKGYDTRFIYGGRGYFDNMNAFFGGNGYAVMDQSSVAESKIGFSNAWGMADEYLFDLALEAADAASAEQKPFFFHVMTTSNHRPYTYPDGRVSIPSGTGRSGAVMYTDWAIGRLLQEARGHPWFDDTVFVIVADHCASSAGRESLPLERYHIPMWIYAPKLVAPREYDRIASQIDVAPTLLGLLNMDYLSSAFGENLLEGSTLERALVGNYQYLGYLQDERLTILEPRQRLERVDYGIETRPTTQRVPLDLALLRAQSYYQEASWVYGHALNGWDRGHRLAETHPGS